jgi:hypothetical protein
VIENPLGKLHSITALVKWIETMFDCRDGPYQPWAEHEGERIPYVALGLIAPDTVPEAQERLRNALQYSLIVVREDLLKKKFGESLVASLGPDRRLPLYWRYASRCRIQEETEVTSSGKRRIRLDAEKADAKNVPAEIRRPLRHKIFTRIAIPGADWSLTTGVKEEGKPYQELVRL